MKIDQQYNILHIKFSEVIKKRTTLHVNDIGRTNLNNIKLLEESEINAGMKQEDG